MKLNSYYHQTLSLVAFLILGIATLTSAVNVRLQSHPRQRMRPHFPHSPLHPHHPHSHRPGHHHEVVRSLAAASGFTEQNSTGRSASHSSHAHRRSSGLPWAKAAPNWVQDKFALCPAKMNMLHKHFAEHRDATVARVDAQRTSCGTDILLKEETYEGVKETCCPKGSPLCAGCAKLNEDKTTCALCSGGYTKIGNECIACVNYPAWLDAEGNTCTQATCSTTPNQGFSSNEACCKCGGGEVAETPFQYSVQALVFGQTSVSAHPVPRTAGYYSIDSNCELAKNGLTIDSLTGELKLAEGCSEVGCGRTADPWSISCTVTAHQSDTITGTALLSVSAGYFSYGTPFLVATESKKSFPLVTSGTTTASDFSLMCIPNEAEDWLTVDSTTGDLTFSKTSTPSGVVGYEDFKKTSGALCSVRGKVDGEERSVSIGLVVPNEWQSIGFETSEVVVTVGEMSATYELSHVDNDEGSSTPPTRFSASCSSTHGEVVFDTITGEATLDGHSIFTLEVETGKFRSHPAKSITDVFDNFTTSTSVRSTITLQCAIYGHYEWTVETEGTPVKTNLTLAIRDNTCWSTTTLSFAVKQAVANYSTQFLCRQGCRKNITCTHVQFEDSTCYFYGARCKTANSGCYNKNQTVFEKIPNCGERSTCVALTEPKHKYLAGNYCPIGDNGPLGPVYKKLGATVQDTFYLTPYDTERDGDEIPCSSGWVIKTVNKALDFHDKDVGYIELHGETVACVDKGASFIDEVFEVGQKEVSITGSVTSTGASAAVGTHPCLTPNTTFDRTKDEGKEEESEEEEESAFVEPIVLDDPSTLEPDDHWLHPCQCFPESWGQTSPVTGASLADVPAGSNNSFMPATFEIVQGEFFCEQEALLEGEVGMHIMDEKEASDEGTCEAMCRDNTDCNFFWSGQILSTKQCRFYTHCSVLVREPGASGLLSALPRSTRKLCRVADPESCWKISKRRNALGASSGQSRSKFLCAWEHLVRQCDQKLLLGGTGVEMCGKCQYADVASHSWSHKTVAHAEYVHGNRLTAKCWEERYAAVPTGLGSLEAETLTCVSGKWYGSRGTLGLSGFACAAYVQVVRSPYRELDAQGKQELYFANQLQVQILVDVKKKMLVTKAAELEECSFAPPAMVGTFRLRSLNNTTLCVGGQSGSTVSMETCEVVEDQLFFYDGDQIKTSKNNNASCLTVLNGTTAKVQECDLSDEQGWYWNNNQILNRATDHCLAYDLTSQIVVAENCAYRAALQQWYPDYFAPLLTPQAAVIAFHSLPGAANRGERKPIELTPKVLEKLERRMGKFGELSAEDIEDAKQALHDSPSLTVAAQSFVIRRSLRNAHHTHHAHHGKALGASAAGATGGAGAPSNTVAITPPQKQPEPPTATTAADDADGGDASSLDEDIEANADEAAEDDSLNLAFVQLKTYETNAYFPFTIGEYVALKSGDSFALINAAGNVGKTTSELGLTAWMGWEVFRIVDAGDGLVAFWSPAQKRFLKLSGTSMKATAKFNWNALEKATEDAKFQVVRFENNTFALYSPTQTRFVCVNAAGKMFGSDTVASATDFPAGQTVLFERVEALIFPGMVLALRSIEHDRFLSMEANGSLIAANGSQAVFNPAWTQDRFEAVLDPTWSTTRMWYGFYHLASQRFLMTLDSGSTSSEVKDGLLDDLTGDARLYRVCAGPQGTPFSVGFRRPSKGYYITVKNDDGAVGRSAPRDCFTNPSNSPTGAPNLWFEIIKVNPLKPGDFVALRSVASKVFISTTAAGVSPSEQMDYFPVGHTAEIWEVVEAGSNSLALYSTEQGRFLKLDASLTAPALSDDKTTDSSKLPTTDAEAFKFQVLPSANVSFALYHPATKRCLQYDPDTASFTVSDELETPQSLLPTSMSSFERFEVAPLTCQGEWSEWTDCTVSCGGGVKTRYRIILVPAQYNGQCPIPEGTVESSICRTQTCPGVAYGGFLPKSGESVADTLKQFASVEEKGVCLQADTDSSFKIATCEEGSSLQFMEPTALSTLLWEKFVAASEDLVPEAVAQAATSSSSRTLADFTITIDCGDHLMNTFSFNANGKVGLKGSCAAGATVGTPISYTETIYGGALLKSKFKDGNCISLSSDMVDLQSCQASPTQLLFWDGKRITSEDAPGDDCLSYAEAKKTVEEDDTTKTVTYNAPTKDDCVSTSKQFWYVSGEYLKNRKTGDCLAVDDSDGSLNLTDCTADPRLKWSHGSGIDGLAREPIICPEGTILNYFQKTVDQIVYKCSQVANLGACKEGMSAQVDISDSSLETLLSLGSECSDAEGLQSIQTESSKTGEWMRLRYTCCALGGVPMSVVPTEKLLSPKAQHWEGIYAPTERDASGRLIFKQRSSFKPEANLSHTLAFNRDTYSWCVDDDCVESSLVHPLDGKLTGEAWVVVEVSDFDGKFEAKGVGKPRGESDGAEGEAEEEEMKEEVAIPEVPEREPPTLLEFNTTEPEFAEECKDDVTPGAEGFDEARMAAVSGALGEDNPCYYVGGDQATWKAADGIDAEATDGTGLTYKNIAGCQSREAKRNVELADAEFAHALSQGSLNTVAAATKMICAIVPDPDSAPMGVGTAFPAKEVCDGITDVTLQAGIHTSESLLAGKNHKGAEVGNDDCDPAFTSMSRVFCDLHCVRDAVKSGDTAILASLKEAVKVMSENSKMLMEHYSTVVTDQVVAVQQMIQALSVANFRQQFQQFKSDVDGMFSEMSSFVSGSSFDTGSTALAKRALGSFITSLKGRNATSNATVDDHLIELRRKTAKLHRSLKWASRNSMPKAYQIERNAIRWAERTEKLMHSRMSLLGIFRNHSSSSRRFLGHLKAHWKTSVSNEELEQDLQDATMGDLDTSLWDIRQSMEGYLEAADQHVKAYMEAVDAVKEYTSTCSAGFSSMKGIHKRTLKAEEHAHEVLQQTWQDVVPALGLLASKVRDSDVLDNLAWSDIKDLTFSDLSSEEQQTWCSADDATRGKIVSDRVGKAMAEGIYGQTISQFNLVFKELAFLKDRFEFGALGLPPDRETVVQAWNDIGDVRREIETNDRAETIAAFIEHWQSESPCAPRQRQEQHQQQEQQGQKTHHRRHSLRH